MNHSKEIHFEGKIAQKAIIVKEGRILLVRNPCEQNEIWEIPGGRMNVHESPKEGLQREIFEELGIECEIHEVVYMTQFLQGSEKKNAFVIVYRATLADESKVFVLDPNEVCEMKWATQAECGTLPFFPEYTKALEIFFETYKKI